MKKLLLQMLLLCTLLCAFLPVTAGAEMVTEKLGRHTGYISSGSANVATITLDRSVKLRVEHACSASNTIHELLGSSGKITPASSIKCSWENDYPYGYLTTYELGPGEYTIRIIPSHHSFSGGKYWLEVYATYDNHAHSYTQKGETVAPTCGYRGYTKYYCSCGDYTKKDYVDSPPHTVVTDPAVAPTCLTTGLTEGSHCSVCQSKIVRQETIPLLAHEPVDGICHMCGDPCGVCGDNIKWILKQETETLEIYGTGDMYGWDSFFDTPWYGYTDIRSATISDGITSIGKYAFGSCRKLTSVSIPKSVTNIDDCAFRNCKSLAQITIPSKVTSIGYAAFSGCTSLTSCVIPNSVTSIGDSLFYGCTSLTDITFPKGITAINYCMFKECSSLAEITIPGTVTLIDDEAFYGCTSLTEITIPSAVNQIGRYVFCNSHALQTVYFDGSAPEIHYDAFAYLTITAVCYDDRDGWTTQTMQDYGGSITWNCLHNYKSVVTKPTCLEQGYTTYTCGCGHIMLGDYVPPTGHSMSGVNCTKCDYMGSKAGDDVYWELLPDGTLMITGNGAITQTNWYGYRYKILSVNISEGVTSICKEAFNDCDEITQVVLPSSLTAIGSGAFADCSSLTSINIPEGVTRIEDATFSGCSKLESVLLPSSLTYIGDSAFLYCKSLSTIVIPANVRTIGAECFYIDYAKGLASIKFLGDAPSIGKYAFYTGVQWFTAYYPKGNSTYTSSVKQKYGAANITWNEYSLCSEHSFRNWEITRAPDCDTDGVQMHTCSKCFIQETEAIPALGHDYGAWKIHRIATTKDPGEERRFCSRCSHYESRAIGEIIIPGDFDGNDKATGEDAIYLIWHTLHPKLFPLQKNADFTGDSKVTDADAVFLLWHCMYPKSYPLT